MKDFLLVVITKPELYKEECGYLEGLVEAGLEKLHIRKPSASREQLEELLGKLSSQCRARVVIHGKDAKALAISFGIPQVHGPVRFEGGPGLTGGGGREVVPGEGGIAVSTSLHSHDEMELLPDGVEYAFISPLFDSISKPGYHSNSKLLNRPAFRSSCKAIGMGGIDDQSIGRVMEHAWDGAAMLGYIWKEPKEAISRFTMIKQLVSKYGQSV